MQSIPAKQCIIAMDHRRQYHHRYLPRTIDLVIVVVVELLGLIHLVTILEMVVSISLRRAKL